MRGIRSYWVYGLIAAAVVIFRLKDFFIPVNRDSGLFAYGGWRILHGALPYADFWDNKLPGVFYINALAQRLFGSSPSALVVFQMVYVIVTCWLFFAVTSRLAGRTSAIITSLLFAFYHGSYLFSEGGNYTETYTSLPVLAAVLIMLNWSRERKGYALPILAGAIVASAGIIKQPAAFVVPAMMIFAASGERRRSGIISAGAVLGGGVAVGVLLLAWMSANGILSEAVAANLKFNRLYFADAYTYGLGAAMARLVEGLAGMALPIAGGVAGAIVVGRFKTPFEGVGRLLVPWFVLDVVGLAMGGRFDHHYFLQILPSSLVLTGILMRYVSGSRRVILVAVAAGLLLFLGPVWMVKTTNHWGSELTVASVAEREYHSLRWLFERRLGLGVKSPVEQTASWVRDHTSESDSIYVWAWDTRIAFLARRRICSRYLHTHPLGATGFDRDARIRELRRDLEREKPAIIVDGSALLPTTAPSLAPGPAPPSFCPFFRLDGYEPIKDFVAKDYAPVADISGYVVYERRR